MEPRRVRLGDVPIVEYTLTAGPHAGRHAIQHFYYQRRKLRFTEDSDGSPLDGPRRRDAEIAARTAVAALGVAAAALQIENDYDLRSRCLLLPQGKPALEMLGRDGSVVGTYSLDPSAVGGDHRRSCRRVRAYRQIGRRHRTFTSEPALMSRTLISIRVSFAGPKGPPSCQSMDHPSSGELEHVPRAPKPVTVTAVVVVGL
jgi:hypothetical protein